MKIKIAKVSVETRNLKSNPYLSITLNLKCNGKGGTAVIDRNFTKLYKKYEGRDVGASFEKLKDDFLKDMQAVVDEYKKEQDLFNSTLFDKIITQIENELRV